MADRLQFKRGTSAKRLTYTPADGELVYDKTLNKLFVGNGSLAGGISLEADDNSRYAKEESMTNSRRYTDLAQAYFAGQTVRGAIVIHLPVSRNANNTMVYMNIRGYNYLNNNGAFSLMLGFYQYNGNNIIQTSASCNGMFPSNKVRYGKATDHTVIILGDTDTVWSYPNIRVAEFVACYSGFTDWTNGWSMAMETDLSAYDIKATPPVYGSNLTKTAEESTKLRTPRNINGTPFDGTANITVTDDTKLSTGGGTVTGQVTIHGTAGNYPLRVRGITGTNGTTADGPLYLQYGIGEATHFGTAGSYTISADGSQYSGSAAKLTTPRLINGTAFDGSKNINISDDTKLPLSGGKLTGPIEIPSAGASWIGGTGGLSAIRLAPSTASSWHPWISQRTNAGNSWAIGQLGETWSISWAPKANIDEGTNATTQVVNVSSSGVTVTGTLNVTGDLVGTPTTATVADGTNNTRLATTAFVQNTVGGYLNKTGLTGGTVTLTNVEVSNAVLSFSGTLTSNLIIVVPTTNRRLWSAINATTGNFTLTVKTASGTGVTVAQGKRNLIYTDGTNVQDGFNDFENIALTGIPTTPTAATATNNTQVASTAFVQAVNSADTGSSSTALTLKNARTFTYTGDVTGSVSFNGGANVSAALTLANSGVSAGTYKSVTVDVKGRVTAGADVVTSLVTSTSSTGTTNVATTNTNTFLNVVEKVGTANASTGTSSQITGAGTVTVVSDTAGKITITGAQTITGNAATATKLQTARTINGVAFDGTKNITIGENNGVFIGAVQWFSGTRAGIPDGYAAADGQLVNRATYPELWASVNGGVFPIVTDAVWVSNITNRASYSQGNGSSTFRFPDLNGIQTNSLKGLFVRGDGNAGTSSGKTQEDAIRNITGALNPMGWWEGVLTGQEGAFYGEGVNKGYNEAGTSKNGGRVLFDASRVVPTADENRPVSAVGIWIIRVNGGTSPLPASGSPATLQANSFNGTQSITGNLTVSGSVTFGNINNLPILGVNQTYQNLVTTRAFGVTYVNTTKASIFVMVSSAGGSQAIMPYVDNLLLGWSMSTYNNGNPRHMVSFIVPPGSTYKVTGGSLDYWTELR